MARVVVWGSINKDVQIEVVEFPRPGETIRAIGHRVGLGGKGANQAIAATRAGAKVLLGGSVGCDINLLEMLSLAAPELDLSHVKGDPEIDSGRAYIQLSQTGENQIVVVGGANGCVDGNHLPPFRTRDIALAQMEIPAKAIEKLFRAARASGGITVLNAAPAVEDARRLFPLTDVLVVNETELGFFAGCDPLSHRYDQIADAAIGLLPTPGASVIITLGAGGALLASGGGWNHIRGRSAKAVDTTGAGDCFCGVMCAALAADASLLEATELANIAASIQVERRGAADAMPRLAEILSRGDELT